MFRSGNINLRVVLLKSTVQFSSVQFSSVAQSCPVLCDPMDCSPPSISVHGIFQVRLLEWVAISTPEDLPYPGIKPASPFSPVLLADSLPLELSGKPFYVTCQKSNSTYSLPLFANYAAEPHNGIAASCRSLSTGFSASSLNSSS